MFLKKIFFKYNNNNSLVDFNLFFLDFFFKKLFILKENKYYFFSFYYNSFLFLKYKFFIFYNYFQFLILRSFIFYFVKLNLIGLGFKVFKYKDYLIFKLGFSHYLKILIPKNVCIFLKKFSFFILSSSDLSSLWNFVVKFYKFKDFNFYKGKGFSLLDKSEIILKIGKQQQS